MFHRRRDSWRDRKSFAVICLRRRNEEDSVMDGPFASALPSRQSGRYWDAAATTWEAEIFSSFHNDRKGVIAAALRAAPDPDRSAEQTSELPPLMRLSYSVFCLKKKKTATS